MQTHADFVKKGLIYMYRPLADFGDDKHVYYFGRTKQACMLELKVEDGANSFDAGRLDLLKKKCKCVGLNTPSRVLLWACVSDIDYCWDELRREPGDFGSWCRAFAEKQFGKFRLQPGFC